MTIETGLSELAMGGAGMNMGKVFRNAVARFPERTAIIDPEGDIEYTYEEWDEHIRGLADAMAETGVGAGDTVGLIMENRVHVNSVYWATQLLGAVFVPMNFRAAAGEVAFLCNNVEAKVLFFSDISSDNVLDATDDFETISDIVHADDDTPGDAVDYGSFCGRGDSESFEPTFVEPEETSLILHTSGTTGQPKGVPVTHRANYARTLGNPIHLTWRPGERTLGIMPNFHEMGRAAMSSMVLLNGTYVAQRGWSPQQALEYVDEYDISMLYLVPTMFHDIVDCDELDDYDVSSVEVTGYAGTAMSERVHQAVFDIFDPIRFVNFYGSSEMNCMTTCDTLDEKPSCAGRAGIHTRARVVTPVEGETVSPDEERPVGELGEIILDASSPEAFDGYLNRPKANETSFENGWYFTGDLGYADEDGDIWVVGRVDDMIISGGENIYPVEVEDVLDANELVRDVAVGSVANDRWGQLVTAFITLPEGADIEYEEAAQQLDQHCRDSKDLADFKRPRKWVFVDQIPKSNVGKKLRRMLRAEDIHHVEGVEVLAEVDI